MTRHAFATVAVQHEHEVDNRPSDEQLLAAYRDHGAVGAAHGRDLDTCADGGVDHLGVLDEGHLRVRGTARGGALELGRPAHRRRLREQELHLVPLLQARHRGLPLGAGHALHTSPTGRGSYLAIE